MPPRPLQLAPGPHTDDVEELPWTLDMVGRVAKSAATKVTALAKDHDKSAEETAELVEARDGGDADKVGEEFGDLLFVIANLARHLEIDPEAALRAANAKFTRRFHAIEAALAGRGRTPEQSDLAEMDALWDAAKAAERAV